jgi:hypothetical protein
MGAQFFSDLLSQNGGNVLLSMGQYNGWVKGMTKVSRFHQRISCLKLTILSTGTSYRRGKH